MVKTYAPRNTPVIDWTPVEKLAERICRRKRGEHLFDFMERVGKIYDADPSPYRNPQSGVLRPQYFLSYG